MHICCGTFLIWRTVTSWMASVFYQSNFDLVTVTLELGILSFEEWAISREKWRKFSARKRTREKHKDNVNRFQHTDDDDDVRWEYQFSCQRLCSKLTYEIQQQTACFQHRDAKSGFIAAVPRGRFAIMSRFYEPQLCTSLPPILLRLPHPVDRYSSSPGDHSNCSYFHNLRPRTSSGFELCLWLRFQVTPRGIADVLRRSTVPGVISNPLLHFGYIANCKLRLRW